MSVAELVEAHGSTALFYRTAPALNGKKTAAVGALQLADAESGSALLNDIAEQARKEGFEALLGPLDGDTWHTYRVVIESDDSLPFLMEPQSGQHDLSALKQAGFKIESRYMSARSPIASTLGETPVSVDGVHVVPWDGEDGEALIRHLFDMSTSSFDANNFFTPISFESFLEIYRPLLPFIDPQHVLFAHDDDGAMKGFLFGVANMLNQTGKPEAILKTYASAQRGVGHLLADSYHRRAIEMGFETIIHALIHEDNTSRDRSEKHGATVFRRYALMGRTL